MRGKRTGGRVAQPIEKRFAAKVDKNGPGGCWLWTATLNATGYGRIKVGKRNILAHRLSYELHVGPIPDGLTIDHLCRNRACVNPAHLEPVTPDENRRRGLRGVLKTHCIYGHEYTPENTIYLPRSGRRCRTCRDREAARRSDKRDREGFVSDAKTYCPRGHSLSGDNLYVNPRGTRCCRICLRAQRRACHQRKKAER